MISRASTASQLSSRAGTWEDADGMCVVMSSRTSTAGDGVLVLRFLLPDTDGVVLLPGLQVVVRRVVLVVVLPMPRGPVVEIPEINLKGNTYIACSQWDLYMSSFFRNHFYLTVQSLKP